MYKNLIEKQFNTKVLEEFNKGRLYYKIRKQNITVCKKAWPILIDVCLIMINKTTGVIMFYQEFNNDFENLQPIGWMMLRDLNE